MLDGFIPVFGNTLPSLASGLAFGVFVPKLLPSPAGVFNVDKSNSGTSLTAARFLFRISKASSKSLRWLFNPSM